MAHVCSTQYPVPIGPRRKETCARFHGPCREPSVSSSPLGFLPESDSNKKEKEKKGSNKQTLPLVNSVASVPGVGLLFLGSLIRIRP